MNRGFSLVELSIVLVILGLLVGGILAGKSLIRASELRAVTTEYDRIRSTVFSFRDKYFAIPGDFSNATSIWGATDPVFATCSTTTSTGTSTCNGNGNGILSTDAESYFFWKHLANAGLIEGSYTNIAGPGSVIHSIAGTNVPASKLKNGAWDTRYFSINSAHPYWFPVIANILTIGITVGTASYAQYPIMATDEAWNLDTKMDDGMPALGKVHAHKNTSDYTPTCTNGTTSAAAYNLTVSGSTCSFIFIPGY